MRGQRFAKALNESSAATDPVTAPIVGGMPSYIVGADVGSAGRTLGAVALVAGAVAVGYALRGNSKTARAVRSDARKARTVARRTYRELAHKVR